MKNMLSSAAESDTGALFENFQEAEQIRVSLEEMGHPKEATPVDTENMCAVGIANGTVNQQR